MQCTSNYPSDIKNSHTNVIKLFKKKFNCPIGYSDHTSNNISAVTAAAFGARTIEHATTRQKRRRERGIRRCHVGEDSPSRIAAREARGARTRRRPCPNRVRGPCRGPNSNYSGRQATSRNTEGRAWVPASAVYTPRRLPYESHVHGQALRSRAGT